AGSDRRFEYQRLHGMGQALYNEIGGEAGMNQPCRIYAPVGSHEDLLAYLVRRLLENGANTSFVNRLADDKAPIHEIVADPVVVVQRLPAIPHHRIPLPGAIFAPRRNSRGLPLWDGPTRDRLTKEIKAIAKSDRPVAGPLVGGAAMPGMARRRVTAPYDRS